MYCETDVIELSPQQLRDYHMFTGPLAPLPRTVHEFNTKLEAQASFLEAGGSPDERLAAKRARRTPYELSEPDDEPDPSDA